MYPNRSEVRYLGYDDLFQPGILPNLSLFEVAVCLIGFAPLREHLAQFGRALSAKGQVPLTRFLSFCASVCTLN